ncbi:peptidoglycan editing factor PgeF [Leptolyngbya sp. FACHB-36]|uniref:peptidoglycan editing factor PgeF n=1 Tax=Leptolyngbya sp. FACHB-36 TaxID=2692808 RepID=UPI001680DC9B|nr:peptidoglycan editing factor PgeF [Leptolyngbya sp. FACHB-36]MBD2022644.1 peptidoglycan editing factor PgeF [Leptolyngbya sp. FACHB-36]
MHTWHWRTWNDLPYLTCSLLDPWRHGFFTQQFWGRSPVDLTRVLHPTATPYRVKQVHGNMVLLPSEIEAATEDEPAADGLVSEQAAQAIWVCSADCTPVLIADIATGQAAAIHAGWRGTALKIVPQAIARLRSQGSQLPDLRIALGPAISGEAYQVSEQVAAEVGSTVTPIDPSNLMASLDALRQLPNSPILSDAEPGRVRLDVRRINALQLEQLGIAPEQVAIAPHCTFQDSANFFSYRRLKQKKAQWSGIISQ